MKPDVACIEVVASEVCGAKRLVHLWSATTFWRVAWFTAFMCIGCGGAESKPAPTCRDVTPPACAHANDCHVVVCGSHVTTTEGEAASVDAGLALCGCQ
jgi:hypothetical protein